MERRESTQSFSNLIVSHKTYQLVFGVHKMTKCFPNQELYEPTSQVNRVEGFKKQGMKDKLKHFNYSKQLMTGTIEGRRIFGGTHKSI